MNIAVKQHPGTPSKKQMDDHENLIIIMPSQTGPFTWPTFPYADTLRRRLERRADKNGNEPLITDLPNTKDTHVSLGAVKPEMSRFELLTFARKLVAAHQGRRSPTIALYTPGLRDPESAQVIEATIAALLAQAEPMPSFKSAKPSHKPLRTIHIYGPVAKLDIKRTYAEAEGNNLARLLTALPPNELTPPLYRERVAVLARQEGWKMEFLDRKSLQRKKCGAFLAVMRGSTAGDDGIVHLRYTPKTRSRKAPIALVGKGICFDTGGTNLKPAKHMLGMHEDMAGSAVALGTLLALTRMEVDFPVDCWLALAQNLIGPQAYTQNEVVTACNGVTIEVMHTDAEGRMVLADTLALAAREQPGLIIDYATLTGACIYALGTRYSGAFTNRKELVSTIIETGVDSGERVWPFPMDSDYDQELESNIADIKQCTIAGEADHILAARFLSRFVPQDTPWVHLDLAAASNKGGLGHIGTDTTGFGVRYSLSLMLDHIPPNMLKAD